MKSSRTSIVVAALVALGTFGACASAPRGKLFLDEHHLGASKVSAADVAKAHRKDLALQSGFDVRYERYWLDERTGTIFCLVRAPSADAAIDVHRLSHGLVADEIHEVQPGILPAAASGRRLFMDTHKLGAGLKADAVADAHRKDLAVEASHDVRFLEYWVDEANGVVHCLAEAPDAQAVNATHREAHGLVPDEVLEVVAGS